MQIMRFAVSMIAIGLTLAGAGMVRAQNYPAKPIRIVTTGTGGGNDIVSRVIAQGVSTALGQPMVIDNRSSGVIPVEIVAKAPPDGYVLLVIGSSLWTGPLLQNMPYDPIRDFLPITLACNSPNVIVVHPSLPVKSVKEFIALAKARPGELSYSSSAIGSGSHLAGELFKAMAHVELVGVPYKSGTLEMADLMGGYLQLTFGSATSVTSFVKSGRLRALAVGSSAPSALFPGLPTVAAAGLPGYEAGNTNGIFAPAKTPESIIKRLNQEIVRFLNTAEAKEKFLSAGLDIIGTSPEESAARIKSEMTRLGKVIKDAGIRAE